MPNTVSLTSLSSINPIQLIRGAGPILVDICCYALFKKSLAPKKAYAVAGFAGIVVLLICCPRSKTGMVSTALFYLIYKVSHYFLTRIKPLESSAPKTDSSSNLIAKSPESQSKTQQSAQIEPLTADVKPKRLRKIPSSNEIATKFDALVARVTVKFEDPLNLAPNCDIGDILQEIGKSKGFQEAELESKIRQIWNSKEIAEQSVQLVQEAHAEALKLYCELYSATQQIGDGKERLKTMAELLINNQRYSQRFHPSNTKTVLHIYRFIRGRRYIIQCPLLSYEFSLKIRLMTEDLAPFTQPGTPQYACREAYNKVIQVYTPLIPYLTQEFKEWLVKDEQGKPFKIIPN